MFLAQTHAWLSRLAVGATTLLACLVQGRETPTRIDVLTHAKSPAQAPLMGICAVIGESEELALALGAQTNLVTHILAPTEAGASALRAALLQRNLYGPVTVEWWREKALPYADGTVNALIVEQPGQFAEAELLRVVTPLGVFWNKRENQWQCVPKPWPAELDEWTHARHAADGNMVSQDHAVKTPTSIRWIGGPPQDDGGRKWYYDHVLLTAQGRNLYVFDDEIVARDSFNGRLLWTKPVKAVSFKETGTPLFAKVGFRTSKVRPALHQDYIYAVVDGKLVILDVNSGETLRVICDAEAPREIAVVDQTVLFSDKDGIRAFSLEGKLRWKNAEPARRMVAGDGRVYYVNSQTVVGLALDSGQPLWRTEHPQAAEAVTCSYYRGVLVLERSSWKDAGEGNGVLAFAGENGRTLWTKEYVPGMTHYKEARAFFASDLVWLQSGKQKFSGYNPLTGEEVKTWGNRGLHCSTPVATEHYLIAAECEFTDLADGTQSRARMFKSACRLPFIPANGLLYTFPVQCECFPMLRGYMALAGSGPNAEAATPRLQPGPAMNRNAVTPAPAADWPMYRRDVFRSNWQTNQLPGHMLRKAWETPLAAARHGLLAEDWQNDPFCRGTLTPLTSAHQLVLVAVSEEHRVVALDAATGKPRWSFVAGGRVDTPPSIAQGRCFFGAHDGYVYCLDVETGELAWRFRAAPRETRIPVYGQLESLWPVAGGVLTQDGVAWFAAGRHPNSDGGVRAFALRVRDGGVVWEKTITDMGVTNWYSGFFPGTKVKFGIDYEPVDLFVRDGDRVAMSRWQFQPKTGAVRLAFTNVQYVAFDTQHVPRGVWGYGIRQNKMVRDKLPAAFTPMAMHHGTTNDVALILAGETTILANRIGELKVGTQPPVKLGAPAVRDGVIAAGGRLYVARQDGVVCCYEASAP
ncbi:MAG: PQQ-binding-like beta-propeller repeat protein [Verrucomicrobiota bacterium]